MKREAKTTSPDRRRFCCGKGSVGDPDWVDAIGAVAKGTPKSADGRRPIPSEAVNLFAFQMLKSVPSTAPSALKSPRDQAATCRVWATHEREIDSRTPTNPRYLDASRT